MQPVYSRIHRLSIYVPATVHDFPFEVLENCLKYLNPPDLVASILACRAWYPAASERIYSHISIAVNDYRERAGRFVCGINLRNTVFGVGSCKIKRLDLDMIKVGCDYIPMIAQILSPTLSSLMLDFGDVLIVGRDYETLEIFLGRCSSIRNLCLESFDFGDDPASITQTIKEGSSCLKQLDLLYCFGNISMFVDHVPIHNLRFLKYYSDQDTVEDVVFIPNLAMKCSSLTNVMVSAIFDSSASLLKFVECCRGLKALEVWNEGGSLSLNLADFKAIASLPQLKLLQLEGFNISEDVISPLARCRGLKWLFLPCGFRYPSRHHFIHQCKFTRVEFAAYGCGSC
jgi:hypothetical protein